MNQNKASAKGRLTGRIERLLRQQTADVVPVVHGQWDKNEFLSDDVNSAAACSLCGELIGWFGNDFPPYCPFCGARMDGAAE